MDSERKWKSRLLPAGLAVAALLLVPLYQSRTTQRQPSRDKVTDETERSADVVAVEPDTQERLGLRFARVEERELTRRLHLGGTVEPDSRKVVKIRPLTRGRLKSVNATIGDRVLRDQVLAVYDNIELGDLVVRRAVAKAARERAESEAEVGREALERARRLVKTGALAIAEEQRREADYERALSKIEEARTEIDQVDQRMQLLGANLKRSGKPSGEQPTGAAPTLISPITAPFSGVVTEGGAVEGAVVDPADTLFVIADISTVWVQGDLYEKDIGLVNRGQEATVEVPAYPERQFEGKVAFVSDVLDPDSRTARVRFEIPNQDFELKLGMFASIEILVREGAAVTAVPESAVQRIDERPVVFVRLPSNLFERRELRTGQVGNGWVQVLDGVSAGEEVVTKGSFQLKAILLRGSLDEEG